MNQVTQVIDYIRVNPTVSLGVAVAAGAIYYLLNRKSRLVRDAEKRIDDLRQERSGHYDKLRPLR